MAERELWQAAVLQCLRDALYHPRRGEHTTSSSAPTPPDVRRARVMLERKTAAFRFMCDMAGFDPAFVRDAYLSGRITLDSLKGADDATMAERLTRNPAAPASAPHSAPDAPRRPDIAETANRAPAALPGALRASPSRKDTP
jgi:hypothetical protein